jgi:citrate lyase synthetase
MKIALVPVSGKPIHAGHWGLIELASRECDEVRLFISTSDRIRKGEIPIYGADMKRIWDDYLEPALPENVEITYGGSPVQHVYEELETAEASRDRTTTFRIYSDVEDILKYTDVSLSKSAPTLFSRGQIERRGVDRNETVNVSGTKMREYMAKGDVKNFKKFLPDEIRQYAGEILSILTKGG